MPVGGLCWKLRLKGALQWHVNEDPFSVETCSCALFAPYIFKDLLRYETGLNLSLGANAIT